MKEHVFGVSIKAVFVSVFVSVDVDGRRLVQQSFRCISDCTVSVFVLCVCLCVFVGVWVRLRVSFCVSLCVRVCVCVYTFCNPPFFSTHSIYPASGMRSAFGTRDYGVPVPRDVRPIITTQRNRKRASLTSGSRCSLRPSLLSPLCLAVVRRRASQPGGLTTRHGPETGAAAAAGPPGPPRGRTIALQDCFGAGGETTGDGSIENGHPNA